MSLYNPRVRQEYQRIPYEHHYPLFIPSTPIVGWVLCVSHFMCDSKRKKCIQFKNH